MCVNDSETCRVPFAEQITKEPESFIKLLDTHSLRVLFTSHACSVRNFEILIYAQSIQKLFVHAECTDAFFSDSQWNTCQVRNSKSKCVSSVTRSARCCTSLRIEITKRDRLSIQDMHRYAYKTERASKTCTRCILFPDSNSKCHTLLCSCLALHCCHIAIRTHLP